MGRDKKKRRSALFPPREKEEDEGGEVCVVWTCAPLVPPPAPRYSAPEMSSVLTGKLCSQRTQLVTNTSYTEEQANLPSFFLYK